MISLAASEPIPSTLLTRVAVGISIAVHVAAVALSLGYAGAGLFEKSEADAVAVTVVTPEEVAALAPEPTPAPEQKPEADPSKLDLRPSPIETASQPEKAQPLPQASRSQPTAPTPQIAPPVYQTPEPDVSVKYQIDLGLKPMAVAQPLPEPAKTGTSDFDAPAMSRADIDTTSIAAFRANLKQCAALPAAIAADDKVMIVLRARFTPDGRLAAVPILIEASASAKGPALMQAAIAALQSCQPFTTLPADKYAEWRVLDMRFTPQDFRKG